MIELNNVSVKYPNGKGVFDINFKVDEGSVLGYLGPNGAGKTTTIRVIMGYMKAMEGRCFINGLDSFKRAKDIMSFLGYIPGEIAFSKNVSCLSYLKYINSIRGTKDLKMMNDLIDRFNLNTQGKIDTFSKGTKQKLAIVSAFMHDPKVLILDEPTSGLDPLMQNEFVNLVLEEKAKGKTILMSSHDFDEVEKSCDKVTIIKEGRLLTTSNIDTLKANKKKTFIIRTPNMDKLKSLPLKVDHVRNDSAYVHLKGEDVDSFIKHISTIKVDSLETKPLNLEEIFLDYYEKE